MEKLMVVLIVAPRRRACLALAAEALRRAAARVRLQLALELRGPATDGDRLDPALCAGAVGALIVTDPEAGVGADAQAATVSRSSQALGMHPLHRCALDAVLADADAVVASALAAFGAPVAGKDLAPAGDAVGLACDRPGERSGQPRTAAPDRYAAGRAHIVAVTSCPTGIAHTFMAAEALKQGALALGLEIRVETRGSVGPQDALSEAEIAAADLVVVAADTQVDLSRFVGKRLYRSGTKAAIRQGATLIETALREGLPHMADTSRLPSDVRPAAGEPVTRAGPTTHAADATNRMHASKRHEPSGNGSPDAPRGPSAVLAAARQAAATPFARLSSRVPALSDIYRHLMTGVSHMLPFIIAGGLLIALSFAVGGPDVEAAAPRGSLAWALHEVGARAAFALVVPALAGFIAFSIADRPGLAPGMIGGWLAASIGAGFLGGIVAGFVAGYAALGIARYLPLPRALAGLKPILLIPLLATAIVGLTMVYVVGAPIAQALRGLEIWLGALHAGSALLFGALLGGMMSVDMGGPVNKTVYAFSSGLLASSVYTPMAATMAAGMTAPLGIALATFLFSKRFRVEEREAGKAAGLLGLAFISEGALPFAARDPLRTIPACVVGSAVTGALCMHAGIELRVPHGGVFVQLIPHAVTPLLPYVAAILTGTVLTALLLGLARGIGTIGDVDHAGREQAV